MDLVGKQLGQYQIGREVGRGGMAVIYQATQPTLERTVAIKVLSPHLTHDPNFVERFRREALAAARLNHPHIVTIYDVGAQEGIHFIAMEFLHGQPLDDILGAGPVPLARTVALLHQVASALDYAHEQGLIHRDIKPANVIVDHRDQATLTDFGIAKAAEEATHLTQSGMIVGTPQYMAPEQIQGASVDARADIYALGIMAYEMLAGKVPFSGDTGTVLYAQVSLPPPALSAWNPTLPAHMEHAVNRALAKNPAERWSRASEFVAALAGAAPVAATVVSAPLPPSDAPTVQMSQLPPSAAARPAPRPAPAPPPVAAAPTASQGRGGCSLPMILGALLLLGLLGLLGGGGYFLATRNPTPTTPAGQGGLLPPGAPSATLSAPPATVSVPPSASATSAPLPSATVDPAVVRAQREAEVVARFQLRPDNGAPLFAYRFPQPPTVDGQLDEWASAVFAPTLGSVFRPENVSGSDDSSATVALTWDQASLYLAARVRDDVLVQEQTGITIFQGDSVELVFDGDLGGDFSNGQLNPDDFQIGFVPGTALGRAEEAFRWFPKAREGALGSAQVASRRIEGGYAIEVAIPWAELGVVPVEENAYGFAFSVSDNDVPGTSQQQSLVSTAPRRTLANPTTWGTLMLMGEP